MSGGPLQDRSGCLTDTGFGALQSASPPAEVVAHLGKCGRCQNRMLARSAGHSADAPRIRKQPPPMWRLVAVILAAVLLVASALMLLSRLR